jgi:hypothetical protein
VFPFKTASTGSAAGFEGSAPFYPCNVTDWDHSHTLTQNTLGYLSQWESVLQEIAHTHGFAGGPEDSVLEGDSNNSMPSSCYALHFIQKVS